MVVRNRLMVGRAWLVVAALAAAFALAACGASGPPQTSIATPAPGNVLTVTITDNSITPGDLVARMGRVTFKITNSSKSVQNLAVDSDGVHNVSPDIQPGQQLTWSVVLDTPSPDRIYSDKPGARDAGIQANLTVGTGTPG